VQTPDHHGGLHIVQTRHTVEDLRRIVRALRGNLQHRQALFHQGMAQHIPVGSAGLHHRGFAGPGKLVGHDLDQAWRFLRVLPLDRCLDAPLRVHDHRDEILLGHVNAEDAASLLYFLGKTGYRACA
jgi:hypothetical protein